MDRNNHLRYFRNLSFNSSQESRGKKIPSRAVYKLKIKMTKSQIQIKLEKLVVQSSSFISLRQKYIGYSMINHKYLWYIYIEIISAQFYSIHTRSIKRWQLTLIINESKLATFSDHWWLESKEIMYATSYTMLSNCSAGEDSWEPLGQHRDQTS